MDGPSGSDIVLRVNGVDKHEIYNTLTSFNIYNTTTTSVALSIANSSGAATFSSSVTATKLIINSTDTGGDGLVQIVASAGVMGDSTKKRSLSVYSTTAENADQPGVILGYDTSGAGIVAARTNSSGQPLAFWTYNGSAWGERMRITSGGTILVNATTDPGSSKLYVNGVIRANEGIISTGTSSSLGTQSRGGNGYYYYWIGYNTELKLYYDATGFVGQFSNTTGIYTSTSDRNKKKDFEESNIGLNEVMQLKPTLYRMKSDNSNGQKELGFIAQEVKECIPNAYVESGDFIGLNFNPIVAALTKAVQELKTELDTLKNK
jgi:hypothetical protein